MGAGAIYLTRFLYNRYTIAHIFSDIAIIVDSYYHACQPYEQGSPARVNGATDLTSLPSGSRPCHSRVLSLLPYRPRLES